MPREEETQDEEKYKVGPWKFIGPNLGSPMYRVETLTPHQKRELVKVMKQGMRELEKLTIRDARGLQKIGVALQLMMTQESTRKKVRNEPVSVLFDEEQKHIIGFAFLSRSGSTVVIDGVYVDDRYRGRQDTMLALLENVVTEAASSHLLQRTRREWAGGVDSIEFRRTKKEALSPKMVARLQAKIASANEVYDEYTVPVSTLKKLIEARVQQRSLPVG